MAQSAVRMSTSSSTTWIRTLAMPALSHAPSVEHQVVIRAVARESPPHRADGSTLTGRDGASLENPRREVCVAVRSAPAALYVGCAEVVSTEKCWPAYARC